MDTLVCAGGSGTRVLEAVLHLCAMGLGPANLRVFVIDSDDSNGNGTRTQTLVNRYQELHYIYGDGPFFRTRLNLLNLEKTQPRLEVWKPVDPNQPFRNVLNYTELSREQKDIVHLLFTEEELAMSMNHGFLGHPSLGAAALALLPLYRENDPLWSRFQGELQSDLKNAGARVMIAGSVFGGTGAATIHPLLKYLKSANFLGGSSKKLEVGAVALVPYFEFDRKGDRAAKDEDPSEAQAARSQNFPLACRSAADYYNHLRDSKDWDFDAMFWIGDDSPMRVAYSKGGPTQKNPAHFVDLLAALATLEFFQNGGKDRGCYYGGQAGDEGSGGNRLSWKNLPMREPLRDLEGKPIDVERAVHEFHMVAMAHLHFFEPLLKHPELERRPYCVPWYKDRFSGEASLRSTEAVRQMDLFTQYLQREYLPWWREIHAVDSSGRIRLLNTAAWVTGNRDEALRRLDNLLPPDNTTDHHRDAVDSLFESMGRVAPSAPSDGKPASQYLRMLHLAVQPAVDRIQSGRVSQPQVA